MSGPRRSEPLLAFDGLPPDLFPVRLEMVDLATRARLWAVVVCSPCPLYIPSLAELGVPDRAVLCRIDFADGDTVIGRVLRGRPGWPS